ncbi:N-6 DNA methylase [Streptomyces sp. NPDC006134]|uniref:HsdM family class I SAM-dependent methyltransferase n=1 Tax=Streptomyces sp. NPDC006134 TaxID=3154467 RepID=UPI0033FF0318
MSITSDTGTEAPLLGVSGSFGTAEIEFARRFDELHQLIYRQGGVRPTNAAVEEVAKLLYLRLWWLKNPSIVLPSGVALGRLFDPDADQSGLVDGFKEAFTLALGADELTARTPSGSKEAVWPRDEPFRLSNARVLGSAASLIADLVQDHTPAISDPLGTAFDALLSGRYDHSGGLGTYLTPSSVARMMAEVAFDLLGESPINTSAHPVLGDPFCGTGRFLVAATEILREIGTKEAAQTIATGIFGSDQSHSSVAKARINMMLYGVEHPLVWATHDSVTDPDLTKLHGKFSLILTNPPFGEGKYDSIPGITQTAKAIPRLSGKSKIDPALAGLVKSLLLLKPGGVLGIVLPDGIIESRAFEDLVSGHAGLFDDGATVAANISLPTSTFSLSGTVAKTSAIFLRREHRPTRVALARVQHVGYVRQAGKAARDPQGNDLPEVPGLIRKGLLNAGNASVSIESQEPLVAVVRPGALQSYDPSRVDPAALEARAFVQEKGGIELRNLMDEVRARRSPLLAGIPFVSVLHIDDLGTIAWHEAEKYQPTTPGILASGGDLIISLLNPSKLRASVVPEEFATVQVSAEFGVFRPHEMPYAVLGLLYSENVKAQLRPLGRGTSSSRRRITEADVLSLAVPNLSRPSMSQLDVKVKAALESITQARATLSAEFLKLDEA